MAALAVDIEEAPSFDHSLLFGAVHSDVFYNALHLRDAVPLEIHRRVGGQRS